MTWLLNRFVGFAERGQGTTGNVRRFRIKMDVERTDSKP